MYDITGGAGLQLTKKTTDQKDLGEPVFSPDGQSIVFTSERDGNKEIYLFENKISEKKLKLKKENSIYLIPLNDL